MLAWLQHSHDLVVLTNQAGLVIWANPRFTSLSGLGATPAGTLWALLPVGRQYEAGRQMATRALAGNVLADTEFECRTLAGARLCVRARTMPFEGQVLWVLQDVTPAVLAIERADRKAELLDMAQEFGRMGVWERDLVSGTGHWDKHVFGFWGLDPGDASPDFETVAAYVHPDDQKAMRAYRDATRRAGNYEQRYRVLRADGGVRHVHAQWKVKNGAAGKPESVIGILVDDTKAFELARSLIDATEQLQLAVDMSNIAVWRHDLKTNLVHYSERAFQVLDMTPRAAGLSLDEVRALIHPDDLPRVLASAQETLQTGKPTDVAARYMRSDGSWRYIMTRRALQCGPAGEALAFLGVGLDVTEQVDATRQSAELARRLTAAAQAAHVGIWSSTPAFDQADWNEQMFELFDLDKAPHPPTLRQLVETRVHEEDRERVLHRAAHYLKHGDSPVELEFRTIRPDGSNRWIVVRADLDRGDTQQRRLLGVVLDVTEHRNALAALRSADQRAALATRSAGIGTWEADLAGGSETWDAQMFALRRLPPDKQPPTREQRLAMVHPADVHLVLDSQRVAMMDDETSQYEFRIVLADGSTRWLASRSIPVRNAQGLTVRRVGVNWDITESKNAQAMHQAQALAERESQAKSQFLSRMSHELRTPMNAVLGFAQLLHRNAGSVLNSDQMRQLGHIHAAGEHLLALIDDVLELSRLEGGHIKLDLQPVDVGAVVARALALVEAQAAAAQVSLQWRATGGRAECIAWADPTRLLQILLNLLSNAIKFNRPQGGVTVEYRSSGASCELRVADTGRGMSPRQTSHLFEPFNRLGVDRDDIAGTGIGLVIVKTLVESMDGTIGVASQAGRGTTFELTLPRPLPGSATAAAPVAAASPPSIEATAQAPVRRQGRLLYIEDNPVNVLLVEELVASLPGLNMVSEGTGLAGVQRAVAEQPQLILVDMQLPDFDGFEVLRRLRAQPRTADIACVALSANAMPEDIARAMAAGFDDYWTKPINFPTFIAALEDRFPAMPEPPR